MHGKMHCILQQSQSEVETEIKQKQEQLYI